MAIRVYTPFKLLSDLFEPVQGATRCQEPETRVPAMNVSQEDESYTITFEVPGLAKEDFTIDLEGGVLTVRGEKAKKEGEPACADPKYLRREIYPAKYHRALLLPDDADTSNEIEASLADGIMTIVVNKKKKETKQVKIK